MSLIRPNEHGKLGNGLNSQMYWDARRNQYVSSRPKALTQDELKPSSIDNNANHKKIVARTVVKRKVVPVVVKNTVKVIKKVKSPLSNKSTDSTPAVTNRKYTSTLDIPRESKTYYTPVYGPANEDGTINPIRVGDNRMVETDPTTENLGEAILTSKNIPIELEIPQTHQFLNGLSITPQEFNFANPQNQDFNNVYQGLRNQGYGRRTARRMMKNSNFWNNIINQNSDIYNQQMDTPEGRMALARANFNSASQNFDKYQQGGKMNDKQLQEAFIQFLAQKSGAKNEKELEAYVKQLGEDGLKQAYAEFTEVMQKKTQKAKQGAKLNYIKQLKHQCPEGQEPYYYKKGGMVNCGCKGVKMEDGGKTPKKQSAVEKFKARNNQQNNQNLKGDWQSQKAKEQQRKNREEAAKGEGESPVTDKNFNKGYKKNEKGGKVSKAGAGCMFKSKFVKKGSKVKMGCK